MLKTFRDVFSRSDSVHDECDGRRRTEITAYNVCKIWQFFGQVSWSVTQALLALKAATH